MTRVPRAATMDQVIETCLRTALAQRIVKKGDVVVITAGVPVGVAGRTNMIQVRVVGETFKRRK